MSTFDLSPLFRSTVGFDRLSRALDSAFQYDSRVQGYPPYNIEKVDENDYRIAARAFERRFQLADYIEVKDAQLVNGLLHINLVREVPEALKPRTIKIGADKPARIAQRKAA